MGKIQKALSKIFIDFAIKTYWKLIFTIISHNYLLFSHIIVWFYNIFMIFNWNSEKKSWKFLENFSFYPNFHFSGSTTLYISCHNLAELWPRIKIFSPKYLSMIPLKVSRRHAYGNPSRLGDIGKDIRGVKLTPLGVYVDQKTLVFPGLIVKSLITIWIWHLHVMAIFILCGCLYLMLFSNFTWHSSHEKIIWRLVLLEITTCHIYNS